MTDPARWGIVSTIKAPLADILGFAAHHLEAGAHRLHLYLDDPDPRTYAVLKAHPKIRVTACDDAYWAKLGKPRPHKHQPRQTLNAAHAYGRKTDVDWLVHIDCDEFLASAQSIGGLLADLPADCLCARLRPYEALCPPDGSLPALFKGFELPMPQRRATTEALYPTFGRYLNGGFLSHVAGKLAYRTGIDGFSVKIHNAILEGVQNPGQIELSDIKLCHMHAANWQDWIAHYRYRLEKGAYRAELKAPFDRDSGGLSMHALMQSIEADGGIPALRAFFDEVTAARPNLIAALDERGLLLRYDLGLDAKIRKQFP